MGDSLSLLILQSLQVFNDGAFFVDFNSDRNSIDKGTHHGTGVFEFGWTTGNSGTKHDIAGTAVATQQKGPNALYDCAQCEVMAACKSSYNVRVLWSIGLPFLEAGLGSGNLQFNGKAGWSHTLKSV